MRKVAAIMAIAVVCLAAVAVAAPDTNKTIIGTITRIDNASKSMVVKDTAGTETTVYWNDASKVDGGELREGSTVKVDTKDQDGKTFATTIQVQAPKKPY
ncbi:MAG TPA: hypothetical protein VIA45_07210 [Thermoanaerobaculia bacterium]|jgi:hypothetical protein